MQVELIAIVGFTSVTIRVNEPITGQGIPKIGTECPLSPPHPHPIYPPFSYELHMTLTCTCIRVTQVPMHVMMVLTRFRLF